jgi:hypothetical protein
VPKRPTPRPTRRPTPNQARMQPQEMALAHPGRPLTATRRADLDPSEALIGEPGSAVFGNPGRKTSEMVKALMVCTIDHGYRPLALGGAVAARGPLIATNVPETAPLDPLGPLDGGRTCREGRGR